MQQRQRDLDALELSRKATDQVVRSMVTPMEGTPAVTPDRVIAATREANRLHAAEEARIAVEYRDAMADAAAAAFAEEGGGDAGQERNPTTFNTANNTADGFTTPPARNTQTGHQEQQQRREPEEGTEQQQQREPAPGQQEGANAAKPGIDIGKLGNADENNGDDSREASDDDNAEERATPVKRQRRKENRDKARTAATNAVNAEATAAFIEALKQRDEVLASLIASLNVNNAKVPDTYKEGSDSASSGTYPRTPKGLMISRTFWGAASEAENADEKYMQPANLVEWISHVDNVLKDYPDASDEIKTRHLVHALRGSARDLAERTQPQTPSAVYAMLFENYLEQNTALRAVRELAQLTIDDYKGSDREARYNFFKDFEYRMRLGRVLTHDAPALLVLFLFGAMPQDIQVRVSSHTAMKKLRAMTWEERDSGHCPKSPTMRLDPHNPWFTWADFEDFQRECKTLLAAREGIWKRVPGRVQQWAIPGDTPKLNYMVRTCNTGSKLVSTGTLNAPRPKRAWTTFRRTQPARARAIEDATVNVMARAYTAAQKKLLRTGKKCFNCLGDYTICGGIAKCTNPPASKAVPELLRQLKAIDANPQAYACELIHLAGDDSDGTLDDETALFACELEANVEAMVFTCCAGITDEGERAAFADLNHIDIAGMTPATPASST